MNMRLKQVYATYEMMCVRSAMHPLIIVLDVMAKPRLVTQCTESVA
jgi:hypothetical protein